MAKRMSVSMRNPAKGNGRRRKDAEIVAPVQRKAASKAFLAGAKKMRAIRKKYSGEGYSNHQLSMIYHGKAPGVPAGGKVTISRAAPKAQTTPRGRPKKQTPAPVLAAVKVKAKPRKAVSVSGVQVVKASKRSPVRSYRVREYQSKTGEVMKPRAAIYAGEEGTTRIKKLNKKKKNPSEVVGFLKDFVTFPHTAPHIGSYVGGIAAGVGVSIGEARIVNRFGVKLRAWKDPVRCGVQIVTTGVAAFITTKLSGKKRTFMRGFTISSAGMALVDTVVTVIRAVKQRGGDYKAYKVIESSVRGLDVLRTSPEEDVYISKPFIETTGESGDEYKSTPLSTTFEYAMALLKEGAGLGEVAGDYERDSIEEMILAAQ